MHTREQGARQAPQAGGANASARVQTDRSGRSTGQMLALQRMAGNAAVTKILRRGAGGQGIAGLVRNKGAAAREAQLSANYGIRIGPPPERPDDHFSHSMLDRIDAVLGGLPPEHIRNNPELTAIQPAAPGSGQTTSEYDGENQLIDMVRPFGMPSWLYTELNRSSGWQRWLMDHKGPMSGFEGISSTGDKALGLKGQKREVMGGTSNVLAHGNLVKWTVRHEMGHSVDQHVGWMMNLMQQPRFGGWRIYSPHSDYDVEQVARAILAEVGLGDQLEVQDRHYMGLLASVAAALDPRVARSTPQRLTGLPEHFPDQDEEFKERLGRIVHFAQLALAQPWTLRNGGGDVLTIRGRTYHVDQHGQWVSYLWREREQHAVSNYQFSTPAEWFAESYAAFYDPKPGPRQRLNPQVRNWFATELPALLGQPQEQSSQEATGSGV
ncbi:MAG: hypothetical protein JO362_05025 [Streptomycetaceae bacterium]|nr:hypothetical protein [Streptomycetaceae bacterium]